MALQRWGDADMAGLLAAMTDWAAGNPLEQRAAAAALCEPRLLKDAEHAAAVLRILDEITRVHPAGHRPQEPMRSRRCARGWATAGASPSPRCRTTGKPLMEKWLASADPDIRWIMRENLKKNRLVRMDAAWVARWRALDSAPQ